MSGATVLLYSTFLLADLKIRFKDQRCQITESVLGYRLDCRVLESREVYGAMATFSSKWLTQSLSTPKLPIAFSLWLMCCYVRPYSMRGGPQ